MYYEYGTTDMHKKETNTLNKQEVRTSWKREDVRASCFFSKVIGIGEFMRFFNP